MSQKILVSGIERTPYELHNLELSPQGDVWGARGRDLHRIEIGGARSDKVARFQDRINAIHIMKDRSIVVATDKDHTDPLTPAKIFLSKDGGEHFDLVHEIDGGSALAWSIDSDSRGHLYVGEYGPQRQGMSKTIWLSRDYGATWAPFYRAPDRDGVHIHRVAVDPLTEALWFSVGDGKENRGLFRVDVSASEADGPVDAESFLDSQATAIGFTENYIYLGEDRIKHPGITRIDRQSGKTRFILPLKKMGNYGGSIYDLATGQQGVVYAPTMKYPEQTHVSALWAGRGDDWRTLMLFESRVGKGVGHQSIAGPDSAGFLYIKGYRIDDAVVSQLFEAAR